MGSPIRILDVGWGDVRLADIYAVLTSVETCFRTAFGHYFNDTLVWVVHLDNVVPCCYRDRNTITLSAHDKLYSQYVYQFSHEYCHYQLPFEPIHELRWLEEALCELASLYMLRQVDRLWEKEPPYLNWRDYHSEFSKYAENAEKNYETINLDFSVEPNDTLSYLRRNEYDRAKNMSIALKLLPLFSQRSELWHAIPFLCHVNERRTFCGALKEWQQASPTNSRAALSELATIFNIII